MQEAQETQVRSLGREDPLKGEMVSHSSILAWKIPWIVHGNPWVERTDYGTSASVDFGICERAL